MKTSRERGELVVRRATREDIEKFSGSTVRPTVTAMLGEIDGEIVGLGGLARINGRWVAVFDLTDAGRKYKLSIVKTAKAVLDEARKTGKRLIYALPDPNEPNAERWLTSLGFEPSELKPGLMVWRA